MMCFGRLAMPANMSVNLFFALQPISFACKSDSGTLLTIGVLPRRLGQHLWLIIGDFTDLLCIDICISVQVKIQIAKLAFWFDFGSLCLYLYNSGRLDELAIMQLCSPFGRARAWEPKTMELRARVTTQPGLQIYIHHNSWLQVNQLRNNAHYGWYSLNDTLVSDWTA